MKTHPAPVRMLMLGSSECMQNRQAQSSLHLARMCSGGAGEGFSLNVSGYSLAVLVAVLHTLGRYSHDSLAQSSVEDPPSLRLAFT